MRGGLEDHLAKAVVAVLVTASAIGIVHLLLRLRLRLNAKVLPPGSFGVPVIGHTLGLFGAVQRRNLDRWVQDRIHRYGPVSKLSVLCTPTVLLTGLAANKLVFFNKQLRMAPPRSLSRIFGERNILDLHGDDHRRVRAALMEFFKPDMLKQYVGKVDAMSRNNLEEHWHGRTAVTVLPLMRKLSLNIVLSLLFGLETGAAQEKLGLDMVRMRDGVVSIPLNLPFMAFGRALRARRRARRLVDGIIRDKASPGKEQEQNNLIARLLSLTDHHGKQLLSHEEILDNVMFALFAGHDTTALVMTSMVRNMAQNPATLAAMLQEHEEIARNKTGGEALTWEDLTKMKFTWHVAQETLRIEPPVVGNFRTACEDIQFGGYCIPKGWKVLWTTTATQMDPSIFHQPAKFDPSRFGIHPVPPSAFVAFGAGHRICPGIDFAKIEILVTMHNLLRNFRWKLSRKDNTLSELMQHGLPIELEEHNTPV